jgi:hypothetical protein
MPNNAPSLWRLAPRSEAPAQVAETQLQDALRLHLRYRPLTSVLMRIGDMYQQYIVVHGCAGCAHERCLPGCAAEMLRRALAAYAPGWNMQLVPHGLATRPYTRVRYAIPRQHAQTLAAGLLQPWPEARLIVSWQGEGNRLSVGALLAVGADGPNPHEALVAQHWYPLPLLSRLTQRWAGAAIPPTLAFASSRGLTPTLLHEPSLPAQPHHVPAPPHRDRVPDTLDATMADWLQQILVQPRMALAPEPIPHDEEPSPWPTGPGTLTPAALGTLIEQLLVEPSFQSDRKGQSGLSKGRLVGLKHPGLSETSARTLMVWLDRAGVLAPPDEGQHPWRTPRPFALTDSALIATKLHATPLPSDDDVRAAYGGAG